MGDCQR